MMKEEINMTLLELKRKGYIAEQDLDLYFTKQNSKSLIDLIESQFDWDIEKLRVILYGIAIKWKSCSKIWADNEILIFMNLINSKGTMTLPQLSKRTGLTRSRVADGIKGLMHEKAVDTLSIEQNTKLVYIRKDYLEGVLKSG